MEHDHALTLKWLNWWHRDFWLQADPGWHQQRLASLPLAQQQLFLRQHAAVWQRALGIPPASPGQPQPLILSIADLSLTARQLLLELVAEICGCVTPLDAQLKIWCRRLAKGLRPAGWLPTPLYATGQPADSLLLLQALWPDLWPRLKLLFPPPMVVQYRDPPLLLPASRLRPLWEAALWQSQRHSDLHPLSSENHVDTQKDHSAERQ
ncbi:hypothetical protein [Winslowiella iniecta]|uniref:hypothetical protein n=1 Tax=Winslowiella iniecta TaxID=1560201 RepID=UPI00092D50C0|nr:hypothetical protein [Winslowiella iniecta]